MKRLLILILLFLSSCTFYGLVKTETTNTKCINDVYVYENDSIRIAYNFWCERGFMFFSIYNKLSTPIYIDWKSSAFIENNISSTYWINEQQIKSSTGTEGISQVINKSVATNYSSSQTNATVYTPERVTSIPPLSEIRKLTYYLTPSTFSFPKEDTVGYYSIKNTPYLFRNFLVFSTKEDLSTTFNVDNGFYVSKFKIIPERYFLGKVIGYSHVNNAIYEYPYRKSTDFYITDK